MSSRVVSRHAPQFQLALPARSLQPVTVVSTPSPAPCAMQRASSNKPHPNVQRQPSTMPQQPPQSAPLGTGLSGQLADDSADADGPSSQQKMSDSDCDCIAAMRRIWVGDAAKPPRAASYSRFEASEIMPNLYLGSWLDADSVDELQKHNVKRVLNVAEECPVSTSCAAAMAQGAIQVKKLDLRDHSDEDITSHFKEALQYIHDGIERGEGVLVHCRQGVSRSATIVLAYLMEYGVSEPVSAATSTSSTPDADHMQQQPQQPVHSPVTPHHPMSYNDAFDYVKGKRPLISPNLGFVLALHEQDKKNGGEHPIC